MSIAFLFPTVSEIPPRLKPAKIEGRVPYPWQNSSIICTGPGQGCTVAISSLGDLRRYRYLLLIGYGGGLGDDAQPGDLVLCDRFMAAGRSPLYASEEIIAEIRHAFDAAGLKYSVGASYTCHNVVNEISLKRSLRHRGGGVVEMENYYAAKMAAEMGLPLIGIRAVLDTFSRGLPAFEGMVRADGTLCLGATLQDLAVHPWHLKTMLQVFGLTLRCLPKIEECCRILDSYAVL